MVLDEKSQILYVFGGRTIGPDPSQTIYSGLYSYNIRTRVWSLLRSDLAQPDNQISLKSRIGHSMLFDSGTKQLYIFAGQRNKDYLSDFYIYDIQTDVVREISRDYSVQGGPGFYFLIIDAGFTQRATLDITTGEIYVLSGLMREKNNPTETVKNSFWIFNISQGKWSRIYQNENVGHEYWDLMASVEPCPRVILAN